MKHIFMVIAALTIGTSAFAKGGGSGFTFIPALSYNTSESETKMAGSTEKSEESEVGLGVKLGYTMDMGFYLGGAYLSSTTSEVDPSTTPATTTDTSASGFGASAGYIKNGFNLIFTYLISASGSSQETGNSKVEFTGSGMQVDVGYSFMFGNWGFGPQFTYSSWSFDEIKIGGAVQTGMEVANTSISPALQFMFFF